MPKLNVSVPVQFKDRRTKERIRLTGLLPGKLYLKGGHSFLSCRPFDVSENGLCILSSDYLSVRDQVILEADGNQICLEVEWLKQDFIKDGQYRYGLKLITSGIDMIALFNKSHCVVLES